MRKIKQASPGEDVVDPKFFNFVAQVAHFLPRTESSLPLANSGTGPESPLLRLCASYTQRSTNSGTTRAMKTRLRAARILRTFCFS